LHTDMENVDYKFQPGANLAWYVTQDGRSVGVSLEVITPVDAKLILEYQNTRNRKITAAQMLRLRDSMIKGEFLLNGDTIVFGEDDSLLDGQHRLSSCLEADESLETFVVWNLPIVTQDTMDLTRPRTVAGQFEKENIPNAAYAAHAANWLKRYMDDRMTANQYVQSPLSGLQLYRDHPGLADSVLWGRKFHRKPFRASPGLFTFLHYIIVRASVERTGNADQANTFFDRVLDGANLETTDPRYRLRDALLDRRHTGNQRAKILAGQTIKAWNAHVKGETIQLLVFKRVERFPKPI
jgi:hypothetical protein